MFSSQGKSIKEKNKQLERIEASQENIFVFKPRKIPLVRKRRASQAASMFHVFQEN